MEDADAVAVLLDARRSARRSRRRAGSAAGARARGAGRARAGAARARSPLVQSPRAARSSATRSSSPASSREKVPARNDCQVSKAGLSRRPKPGQEEPAVQRRRLLERLQPLARPRAARNSSTSSETPSALERDRVAHDGEPASAERGAQGRERAAQRGARPIVVVLGPQQPRQRVAVVGAALDRQVGDERHRLARVDGERGAVDQGDGRTEERQPQLHARDRRRNGSRSERDPVTISGRSFVDDHRHGIAHTDQAPFRRGAGRREGGRPARSSPRRRPSRSSSRSPPTTRSSPTSRARAGPVVIDSLEIDSPALDAPQARRACSSRRRSSARASSSACSTSGRASRAGLLLRRPQAARLARLAGGARAPGRAARPPPGGRGALAGADRAGAAGRDADPAELPPQAAPRPARLAGDAPTTGPAREVGGDFYDFLELPGDQLGIVIGDVTDKGVPAAMVMAATRSVLRASAQRIVSPGEVLEPRQRPDVPGHAAEDVRHLPLRRARVGSGLFRFANAGHNLPYVRTAYGTIELRATGMPLGLMPGIEYEETEAMLEPGQTMLLHSDGVAEAHGPGREMFGFPRLMDVVGARRGRGGRDRPRAHRARPLHARGLGAGGRHHARRGPSRRCRRRSGPRCRSSTRRSRSRASRATSGWPPSGSPRRSRRCGSSRRGSRS